jgi:hypothetical protein
VSAQQTENDANSQRVLLNFETLEKNKKVEEQEQKVGWTITTSRSAPSGATSNSQAAYLKP